MMLGDTFTETDALEESVHSDEDVMGDSPKDEYPSAQLGKAFVLAHNYPKAIEQYQLTLKNTTDDLEKLTSSYDLANLFFKLKNYEQAKTVLNDMLARADVNIQVKEMKDTTTLLLCLKGSLLLSKVQHLLGKLETLAEVSNQSSTDSRYLPQYKVMFSAKNIQNWLLREQHGQHADAIREQRNVAAEIYFHFSQVCELENDFEKAMILLKEALNCNAQHKLATLALAKIQLSRGEVNEFEEKCASILREDPFNVEAGDILVQSMLCRELYDSAIVHLKQNLARDPNHYPSMAQLIRLLQSVGQIDEARQYVLKAETASIASHTNAGLYFCKGLIAHYFNNRVEAVQMMNRARADAEWGKQAIHFLIEIYLNIDKELALGEGNLDGANVANEEGIKTAWKLLGESRLLDGNSTKQLVLECYATMATRQKADIEFALGRLTEALAKEEKSVPILLAVATAQTLLHQTAKAKSHLQVINRAVYKRHYRGDFERAWLMLASIHLQSGKRDAAEELCRKCLKYNKNCSRAWECLALVVEAGHSSTAVVGYLENAWKCNKEASAAVGHHLALTYLKEKRYIETILVCHKVLTISNKYPQIKKEILDKARLCVRV